MSYQDIKYFELEAIQEGSALDQEDVMESISPTTLSSSSAESSWAPSKWSNRWYGRRDRATLLAKGATVLVVLLIAIVGFSSTKQEEDPSSQLVRANVPFGIGDLHHPDFCAIQSWHDASSEIIMDPGYMPYGVAIDRSYCEGKDSQLAWVGTLRCYNLRTRWCFAGLSDGFTVADLQGHPGGCQVKFFEKDDIIYNHDGRRMPESFKSRCGPPASSLWHSTQPVEGCGKSQLEFCNLDGTLNWDRIHEHKDPEKRLHLKKKYNCREFEMVRGSDEGCWMNDAGCATFFRGLCEEQMRGCDDRLYRGCDANGRISQELTNAATEECLLFDEIDMNLVGRKTDQGVDLVCMSPEWSDDDIRRG